MTDFLNSISDKVPEWAKHSFGNVEGISLWHLTILLIVVVVSFMIRTVTVYLSGVQLRRLISHLNSSWGRDLIYAASSPLGYLSMAGFLAFVLPWIELNERLSSLIFIAIRLLASTSAVWLIYKSIDILAAVFSEKAANTESKLDDQLIPLLRRGLKIITIFADKPFSIGDQVSIAGIDGFVEHIGFRSTRIRTFQNSLVTVPNHKFTESVVDNYGLRNFRRIQTTIGLVYETPPEKIDAFCRGVKKIILDHPQARQDFCEVNLSDFGDSSFDILLYFFLKVPTWVEEARIKHELFMKLISLAAELEVDFAFPTRTVHLISE